MRSLSVFCRFCAFTCSNVFKQQFMMVMMNISEDQSKIEGKVEVNLTRGRAFKKVLKHVRTLSDRAFRVRYHISKNDLALFPLLC